MLTIEAHTIDKDMALGVIEVDDYITKPFVPEHLVQRIERFLSS